MSMLYPNGSAIRPHVSSPFGRRPNVGAFSFHYGADLTGYTTVRAAGEGRVTFAGWMNSAAGNTALVDLGGGITEVHMHLASFQVARGSFVSVGDPLGAIGRTGNATGNCDHFEIRVRGTSVEPLEYVAARIASTSGGNASPTTSTASEEDDMKLIKVNGSIFLLSPGQIKRYKRPAQVQTAKNVGIVQIDLTGTVAQQNTEFANLLDGLGIPQDVLDSRGWVRNPETGKHEEEGLWNWPRAVLAKKA